MLLPPQPPKKKTPKKSTTKTKTKNALLILIWVHTIVTCKYFAPGKSMMAARVRIIWSITTTSTQNKTYHVLQDCSPYSCSSYNNINTYRPKNQTISSIYIQTSSCIQRSVQVLILSEHNHSLEFTTSNYSSMPNSQHV